MRLEELTADQVRKWHIGLTNPPARVRTKKGSEQKFRHNDDDQIRERRRKSTANRILTIFKAALNRSWRDKHVTSDRAWRSVEPFKNVESARIRYLSLEEARASSTPQMKISASWSEAHWRAGQGTAN